MEKWPQIMFQFLPLLLYIGLGYATEKVLPRSKKVLAWWLIYLIGPIVLLNGGLATDLKSGWLVIPFYIFLAASTIATILFFWTRSRFVTQETSILAFASGTGNVGYFGIPISMVLFGPQSLGTVSLVVLGMVIYEFTYGIFLLESGFGVRKSIVSIVKLPMLYAFLLGILLNYYGYKPQIVVDSVFWISRQLYSILGMVVVGMGIASIHKNRFNLRFHSWLFTSRFILWPILTYVLITIDKNYIHALNELTRTQLMILAWVPIASNTVAMTTQFKMKSDDIALAVVGTTIIATVLIPVIYLYFLG